MHVQIVANLYYAHTKLKQGPRPRPLARAILREESYRTDLKNNYGIQHGVDLLDYRWFHVDSDKNTPLDIVGSRDGQALVVRRAVFDIHETGRIMDIMRAQEANVAFKGAWYKVDIRSIAIVPGLIR